MLVGTKRRRRKSGTSDADHDRLKQLYDKFTRDKRRPEVRPFAGPDPLMDATGDPLVQTDRPLALKVYGLADAPRPKVALRKLEAAIYGDSFSGVVDMAIWFLEHRSWSVHRCAGEAVVLSAERGAWIGALGPASFDKAVDMVRTTVPKQRARVGADLRIGWTGRYLYVVPAPGLQVRRPFKPYEPLPATGAWVPDDAHWRRRIAEGGAIRRAVRGRKKTNYRFAR